MKDNDVRVVAIIAVVIIVVAAMIAASCASSTSRVTSAQQDAISACHRQASNYGWHQSDLSACLEKALQFNATPVTK